ncbi:hypothetical protein BU17DRAFT_85350 [Hysterangium stoloniferum]|nr:hypothetical protein BU17DRAFT_85350 [Hysterangium stoloniferum]
MHTFPNIPPRSPPALLSPLPQLNTSKTHHPNIFAAGITFVGVIVNSLYTIGSQSYPGSAGPNSPQGDPLKGASPFRNSEDDVDESWPVIGDSTARHTQEESTYAGTDLRMWRILGIMVLVYVASAELLVASWQSSQPPFPVFPSSVPVQAELSILVLAFPMVESPTPAVATAAARDQGHGNDSEKEDRLCRRLRRRKRRGKEGMLNGKDEDDARDILDEEPLTLMAAAMPVTTVAPPTLRAVAASTLSTLVVSDYVLRRDEFFHIGTVFFNLRMKIGDNHIHFLSRSV